MDSTSTVSDVLCATWDFASAMIPDTLFSTAPTNWDA
eukprot:CAMPEP_0202114018 /NCGR_PEP_ID=MMETSP0965-20130614/35249_1 /ASSEMBLY_ACC=CAM_ASM_000507 /TAXON_ID=4773 /ORGANISM="Schizochytrium aggregatum, Strain ATCC28209" /LENGTH=36 /DNA_ID= /DNA_START= /DNA_END= /DNA_ORIENTATION=